MRNLMKCEMLKIRKSFPLKVLFLLMFVLSLVSSISSLSYIDSPLANEFEIAFTGYDAFFSSMRDMPTITIIGIIVIGILICSDFENRTIQTEIAAGYSRTSVLLSKTLSFGIAYALVFLPYPLGRLIFQSIFIDFGPAITVGVLLKMVGTFITIVLIGMALDGVVILFAFILRKSIIVMGIGFVLVVLGGNALLSFGVSNPALGTILGKTPIGLFKTLAVTNYEPTVVLQAAIICAVCIGAFVALTYAFFRKAELK